MDAPSSPYPSRFYDGIGAETLASAEVMVPMVLTLLKPTSVIDVGCGRGLWLSVFQQHGVADVFGLEGPWVDPSDLVIAREKFLSVNLEHDWQVSRKYDLALCLEVAEHLSQHVAPALVGALTKVAPAVMFSAALPGQGGTNHVNEQWPAFWQQLFRAHDFVQLDPFRRRIWQDSRVAWYYQQNTYLFVHNDLLSGSPALQAEKKIADRCDVTLVHGKILHRATYFTGALQALPGLFLSACRRRWHRRAEPAQPPARPKPQP